MTPRIAYASFQNHFAFSLNRAEAEGRTRFQLPADGWYQIASYGEMRKPLEREGAEPVEIVQVFNRASAKRVVANFRELAQQPNFAGLLSDFDHFSFDKSKSTVASAWIENLDDRDDGLWAKLRLSGSGESALTSGDYRGFSPVFGFEPRDFQVGERVEPDVLLAGALTNQPTFRGMVPLSNRQGEPLAQTHNSKGTMDYKAKLLALLGLPATATDAEIEAALGTAGETMNNGQQYSATKNRLDSLQKDYDALLADQVERDLDAAGLQGKAREDWKGALTKNRAEALPLLTALGKDGSGYARTHNRDTARSPSGSVIDPAAKATAAEEARAARVANRATEIMRTDRVSYAIAFNRAEAAEPPVAATK